MGEQSKQKEVKIDEITFMNCDLWLHQRHSRKITSNIKKVKSKVMRNKSVCFVKKREKDALLDTSENFKILTIEWRSFKKVKNGDQVTFFIGILTNFIFICIISGIFCKIELEV